MAELPGNVFLAHEFLEFDGLSIGSHDFQINRPHPVADGTGIDSVSLDLDSVCRAADQGVGRRSCSPQPRRRPGSSSRRRGCCSSFTTSTATTCRQWTNTTRRSPSGSSGRRRATRTGMTAARNSSRRSAPQRAGLFFFFASSLQSMKVLRKCYLKLTLQYQLNDLNLNLQSWFIPESYQSGHLPLVEYVKS